MKRIYYYIGGVFLIFVFSALIVFLLSTPDESNTRQTAATERIESFKENFTVPTSQTITVGENNVQVQNFFSSAEVYNEMGDTRITSNDRYEIVYFPYSESFFLLINDTPVREVREAAQIDFLTRLGISQDQACQLNVDVYLDKTVRSSYPHEVGMSFCDGADPLRPRL
jgi:hypothetical protein